MLSEFDMMWTDEELQEAKKEANNSAIDNFVSRLETVAFTKTQWDLIKIISSELKK